MEKEQMFHILGIAEARDEEKIRQAYREKLKRTNPEDDPEGFKRLRQAYEEAMALVKEQERRATGEKENKGEIDLWMERVEQLYDNLMECSDIRLWEEVLADPVCEGLDTAWEARERLLLFFMNHIQLPHKIWKVIDASLHITDDMEILSENYPVNFLSYIKYYVENETFVPYEFFRYRHQEGGETNRDAYLNEYFNIKQLIDNKETEGVLQS